jgi:hypothetical protein
MVLTFIMESFLPSFLNSRVTLFDTECRIIRQANKAILSVAASNIKGSKLKISILMTDIFLWFLGQTTKNNISYEGLVDALLASDGWWYLQSWKSQHMDPCLKHAFCPQSTPFLLSLCCGKHERQPAIS